MKFTPVLCLLVFILPMLEAQTPEVLFPDDIGLMKVTDFGAIPDDGKDDTEAINKAIRASYHIQDNVIRQLNGLEHERQSLEREGLQTLYFPNGTYNISDTLEWLDENGDYRAFLVLQGQSQDGVILKLKDNTFTDQEAPQAMIFTACAREGGEGNVAFSNYIQDMTLDTGVGNVGAYGIDHITSNVGAIRRVTIRSGDGKGLAGIYLGRKYPGPWMLKDVTIEGFDYGLDFDSQTNYNATIKDLTLRKQNVAGIRNNCNIISVQNLVSENRVPALIGFNDNGRPLACIIDSRLTGGDPDEAAIAYTGALFLRNVAISGYKDEPVLNLKTKETAGSRYIGEYVSPAPVTAFGSPPRSLNLPVVDIPDHPGYDPEKWEVVPMDEHTSEGIQAAIDRANAAGKHTVCLSSGKYELDKTIVINGTVERIFGFGSQLIWNPEDPDNHTAFVVKDRNAPHLFFEHVTYNSAPEVPRYVLIHDYSKAPVIFRDLMQWGETIPYVNEEPKRIFIENCAISQITFKDAQVWAWQFDTEMNHGVKAINDGGDLWVLGIKTEWPNPNVKNMNGGRMEIIGGLFYPPYGSNDPDKGMAGIINVDSQMSASFAYNGNQNEIFVEDTQNGETRNYTFTESSKAGHPRWGKTISLYSSHSYEEVEEEE